MADNKSFKKGVPEGMSVEQVLGLDVRRYWASGVQVTSAEGFTFLVFREQMAALTGGAEQIIQKNVVSLVVPTEVARQLRDILDSQFPTGSGGQNGQ